MTTRMMIVIAVVALAFLVVGWWERRPGGMLVGAARGVTVVTGPDCRICPQAIAALDRHGVRPTIVDISRAAHLGVMSIPTVLVVDHGGSVVLRRSGRSAVADAPRIAAAAKQVAR